jgi:hypothetical protein
MITPAEREFALKVLDETRDALLSTLEGLSPEQLSYRPELGRWSVADNTEHIIVAERRLVRALERLLSGPPDMATRTAMGDQEVLHRTETVVERLKSPENVLPASRWPAPQLGREFETVRQTTRNFANVSNGDLRRYFMPHPVFGNLDAYQWLLFTGAHSQRHMLQSKSVIASANFPSATVKSGTPGRTP